VKLSQTTKEILQIVVFLVVVGILLTAFVIYPLGETKDQFARPDIEAYVNEDTVIVNDPASWTSAGFAVDTFKLEVDLYHMLACLRLEPDSAVPVTGTAILVPHEDYGRDSLQGLAQALLASGKHVIVYDQRSTGLTTGSYRGMGVLESTDLAQLVSHSGIHEWIKPPLTVIGYGLGADAAILAAAEDQRIEQVIAVEPYLSTERLLDVYKEKHESYWIPMYRTVMFWWYKMRSSNAPEYRDVESLEPVVCETWLFTAATNDHVEKLKEISPQDLLRTETVESASINDILPILKNAAGVEDSSNQTANGE